MSFLDLVIDKFKRITLAQGDVVGTTSGPTTTSSTPARIPEMVVTRTTAGRNVFLSFTSSFDVRTNDAFDIIFYVDGTQVGKLYRLHYISASGLAVTAGSIAGYTATITTLATGLSAGSHTFETYWDVASGTARCRGVARNMSILEQP